VTTDDANAIQNAIVDAKGDLIAASAADTPARLAVGNNGETLVADSSTSTGLRYTAGTVQSNPVLNSAFQVWQRGTSVAQTTNGYGYTADRWSLWAQGTNNNCTGSRQVTGDTTNLPNIQYCARVQRNSGQTGTSGVFFAQFMETINSIPYAGKTVTMSFYARAGANFSAASNSLIVYLVSGTGTDQSQYAGYTGQALPVNSTATLTTTWQRFTYTGTVASTATELTLEFGYTPSGTAGANDYFEITGVQIDIGSVALPFRTYAGTIQGELSAAQRYYWLFNSGSSTILGTSFYQSTTRMHLPVTFPVTMRTAPSLVATSGTNYYNFQSNGDDNFNSLTIGAASPQSAYLFNNTEISGTAGVAGMVLTNNASASVAFSAEL
jgi:hypothetical protein